MAYDKSTRNKVRAKYVQGMALATAAEACKVPYNTARNWKRADAEAGADWDIERNARHMTKTGIEDMANQVLGELAEQFLATIQVLKADKSLKAEKRADILVRLMDGYNKAIAAASRAMPNANRLAVAMDVLRFLNAHISEHFPKLRGQFIEVTESAGEAFAREFGSGA
ncbi:MAG: DUF1804 family protein [Gammaproteobacteria bacterium]